MLLALKNSVPVPVGCLVRDSGNNFHVYTSAPNPEMKIAFCLKMKLLKNAYNQKYCHMTNDDTI